MSYYNSNYPPSSGPPPPGGGYGGYPPGGMAAGGYGGQYGGGYQQQSAYNVNQYGGGGYGGGPPQGAVPGFTVPAYGAPQHAPPQQRPPASMQYAHMQNNMANQSMQHMQMRMYKQMGLVSDDEEEEEEYQRSRRNRRRRKRRDYDEADGGDSEEETDREEERKRLEEKARKAEEKAKALQEKLQDNAGLKDQCRQNFINELMRRQTVSGTFEETQGVVFPFAEYDEQDPVAVWFKTKKEGADDIAGQKWDADYDCQYLRYGMRGAGTNEKAIIDVVSTRCNAQRNTLLKDYKTAYGRDLMKDLKSELSGDFKSSILACFETPARYDAWAVKNAIYGAGTDEDTLIEILMTRTNAQIQEMVQQYNQITYGRQKDPESSLEKDITEDTSGDFKRLCISAAQGNRRLITREQLEESVEEVMHNDTWSGMFRVNYQVLCASNKCKKIAQELYQAGEKKLGTDEETFNRIFSTKDYYTLRLVWDEYVKLTQRDILNSVDRETSGDLKRGLRAIAMNIKCRPMFFAERLYKSMKGAGTDDATLIRIVVSRAEIDMHQIKRCFLEKYSQTLWNFIKDDTSGDYRKLLLGIVGRD